MARVAAAVTLPEDGASGRDLEALLLRQIDAAMASAAGLPSWAAPGAGAREADRGDGGERSRCIALSAAAVLQVQRLDLATIQRTRSFLYRYNTAPAGLRWRRELATPHRVREHLLGASPAAAEDYLTNSGEDEPSQGWWYWQRAAARRPQTDATIHKLYVSPTCDLVGLAFRASFDVLRAHQVRSFKVGCSAHGLLRPDKFVAYFDDLDHLTEVADALAARLDGVAAQGAPFTVPLGDDGLLSRGVDPPKPKDVGRPWSWRALVTARIAKGLHARRAGAAERG